MKSGADRMYCERSGNAALFSARISYGPEGRVQYGERKRHNIRGTRFSLPAPKGGREGSARNPLLAEDELMMRKHLIRQGKKSKDKVDPFVPEYNSNTWHSSNNVTVPKVRTTTTTSNYHPSYYYLHCTKCVLRHGILFCL